MAGTQTGRENIGGVVQGASGEGSSGYAHAIYFKKLRYREEHSASVVLSWCTLWHFWGENMLMASQLLLCNWPRKLSYRIRLNNAKYTASTTFKVIQGQRFWYPSKAHMRLPLVINTNLPPILHRFQVVRFSPPICSSYSNQTGSGLSLRGESLGSFEIPRESSLGYCNRDV